MGRPSTTKKSPLSLTIVGLREYLGESQHKFALRLATSAPVIGRWETTHEPGLDSIRKLWEISRDTGYRLGVETFGSLLDLDEAMQKMARRRVEILSARNLTVVDGIVKSIWKRVSPLSPESTKEELLDVIADIRRDALKLADRVALGGRKELLAQESQTKGKTLTVDLDKGVITEENK